MLGRPVILFAATPALNCLIREVSSQGGRGDSSGSAIETTTGSQHVSQEFCRFWKCGGRSVRKYPTFSTPRLDEECLTLDRATLGAHMILCF